MRTYYKLLLVLLLIPFVGLANNDLDGRYTKQKKINKKYNVSANSLLKINNSYGNIDVTTWDQNRVEIEVIIKTNGNDEEKVRKRLDEIDVQFDQSSSGVSAKTLLDKNSSSSWWSKIFDGNSTINIEINYRIKAPVKNNVNLNNDYGNISIDRLEGDATINCDYGRLDIGELLGNNNYLSFDYTRNSHIGYLKRGKINADYSDYTIEEAGILDISADYTKSNIEKVENLKFNCDYGSISLGKVKNVKGNGDYLSTKIGLVYNTLELDLDYGSASIEKIMKSAKRVNIGSDYTGIKIGYDQNNPFSFQINTSYGNVKGIDGKDFQVQKRNQSNTKNYYEGYYLSNKSGGIVEINSNYGNITFLKLN